MICHWKNIRQISPVFEEDIYDAISMETCVNKTYDDRCTWTGCYGKGDRASRSVSGRVLIVIRKMSIAGHRYWEQ